MRSAPLLLVLCLSLAASAAQAPAGTSTGDPYEGGLKGKIYNNPFFGFSLELPKGWTSQLNLLQPPKFLSPETIERLKAEFRKQGILLSVHPELRTKLPVPGQAPLISRDPPYGAESKNPYGIRNPSPAPAGQPQRLVVTGPSEGLYITAYPLADSSIQSSEDVLAREAQKLRSDIPDVDISEISETTIGGQRFFRAHYITHGPDPKRKEAIFSTRYVTVLKGYVVAFSVAAGEAKKRDQLLKLIEAVRFTPE